MPVRPTQDEERRKLQRWTGQRIRTARGNSGMTQGELAQRLGFRTGQWVSDIERGVNSIDAHELRRVARVLNYPTDYFLDPEYDMRRSDPPRNIVEWLRMYPDDHRLARMMAGLAQSYGETDTNLHIWKQRGRPSLHGSSNPGITGGKEHLLVMAGH